MPRTISPQELDGLRRAGKEIELIDVRTPAEFREIHVDFARNVPLDRLDSKAIQAERTRHADQPLYVVCRSGSRGKQACEKLLAAGLGDVVNVEGGTLACEAAGMPMVRGKKAISLERQVRIAAGFLVLVGAVLAMTVHPYFAGLSAFVGAGLMFAGITDTCGMAMILARMPWNQVASNANSSGTACRIGVMLLALLVLEPAGTFAREVTHDAPTRVQPRVTGNEAARAEACEQEARKDVRLRNPSLRPSVF